MTEQNLELYQQQRTIILGAFKELTIFLNGYRNLQNSGSATEDDLNLFRLSYCAWFYAMENSIILREHLRSIESTEVERQYSIRRILVSIYEMNKHLFGVESKTEKKALWTETRHLLVDTDAEECNAIDKEIQSFKEGFVNMDTKNSRGIFEHYADTPDQLEHEMKELSADVGDVHMLKFIQIISKIAKLSVKRISIDLRLGQYIDNNFGDNDEPEMFSPEALPNLQRIILLHSNKQVGYYSCFASFYNLAETISSITTGKSNTKAVLLSDFNKLQLLCTQIQRDISYALLSVSSSDSRVEQFLNVRYIFRHLHEGFKRIYGFDPKSQEKSYWVRCVRPYISGINDEQMIARFNEMDSALKAYAGESVKDERKRALLTHIRVNTKKPDDYIPELMDWCQSTTLISEISILTNFQNTVMKLSEFTEALCKEVLKTI